MWSQGLGESFSPLLLFFWFCGLGLPLLVGGVHSLKLLIRGAILSSSITSLASQLWNKDRNAKARHRGSSEWWVMSGNMEGTQRWNARSSEQFAITHSFPSCRYVGCVADGGSPQKSHGRQLSHSLETPALAGSGRLGSMQCVKALRLSRHGECKWE